eukprot:TRINITY_DN39407_c0_g1_i2.p2 TRINITY_DN39407_c0_g1~~TRINITY_DN39407_c0_g1_i2.p2  ORF type:complete len:118 (-),score=26.00 TRINITY_DN39407_c0_g1_i2:23-376(-)
MFIMSTTRNLGVVKAGVAPRVRDATLTALAMRRRDKSRFQFQVDGDDEEEEEEEEESEGEEEEHMEERSMSEGEEDCQRASKGAWPDGSAQGNATSQDVGPTVFNDLDDFLAHIKRA